MKNRKIGIMTFHRAHNYGAILQAIALQKLLEKKYNVFIIDFYNKHIYDNYKPLRPIGRNIFKWPIRIIKNIKNYKVRKRRYLVFNSFIGRELKINKYIKEEINKYDVLITGSDQVWNPQITGGLIDEYTINIGNSSINRISYAASCGTPDNIKKNKVLFRKKLNNINHISIREESCLKPLNAVLPDKDINVVLDPTLLFTKEQWDLKINEYNSIITNNYILVYVVEPNEELDMIVEYLSKKIGIKVLSLNNENKYKNQIENNNIYNPYEFISLIKNAEYVITTSFHATVFSIIYNKNFWVVPHKKTGSRVTDLLSKVNLNNRVINSFDEFKQKKYDEIPNWVTVNKKLETERQKSIRWLFNSIEK